MFFVNSWNSSVPRTQHNPRTPPKVGCFNTLQHNGHQRVLQKNRKEVKHLDGNVGDRRGGLMKLHLFRHLTREGEKETKGGSQCAHTFAKKKKKQGVALMH